MNQPLNPPTPILLVDDESAWLRSLALVLERSAGLNHLVLCQDPREVMGLLTEREFSLVLLDLTMPHLGGEALLEQISQHHPELPVIILSGMNQLETAVRCVKLGAFDYFVKTVEEDRLCSGVLRALRMQELQRENDLLQRQVLAPPLEHPEAFSRFVTCNDRMRALFRYLEAVAPSSQPVLITGESGTGKELIARALHDLGRPQGPWVAVNAAGLDDTVFADTLFGHTRGAFTGADQARAGMLGEASGGTLFLDEIGDLSAASQVKLLRLLQEGEYFPIGSDRPKKSTARIVVATNHDLAARQATGHFRKDLYYRLRAHQVHLPPLHERKDDIVLLLAHFLAEAATELGKPIPTPPPELAVLLTSYHFPGNVRELRAMVFDAVSAHQSRKLSMDSFKQAMGLTEGTPPPPVGMEDEPPLRFGQRLPSIDQAVQLLVEEALQRSGGNQSLAASFLGISRPALNKRLKKTPPERV